MKTRTQTLMKTETYFPAAVKKEKKKDKDDMAYMGANDGTTEEQSGEMTSFEVQDVRESGGGEEGFCDKCNKWLQDLLGPKDNTGTEKLNP